MISIVISEKGGAERREVFEHDEITVGRVKGNDVLLPKGNVSKQHARLIVRDGRYIVSDLKSTNGTYVNHRRITHATLVREGDRIYIGDFILRIETPGASEASTNDPTGDQTHGPAASQPPTDEAGATSSIEVSSHPHASSSPSPRGASQPSARRSSANPLDDVVSHFPLEHDPDSESGVPFDVPAPPRLPYGVSDTGEHTARSRSPAGPSDSASMAREPTSGLSANTTGPFTALSGGVASEATPSGRTSQLAVEEMRRGMQREYVAELCAEVERELGAAPLELLPRPTSDTVRTVDDILERIVAAQSPAPELDVHKLLPVALRELVALGTLDVLLGDETVSRMRITHRDVVLQRRGVSELYEGIGFTTETGLVRAIRRLCADLGRPIADDEPVVERELVDGRQLSALLPPAAVGGAVLQIRRTRSEPTTLNNLVRGGAISRGIAMLLTHAMAARANVLVVGPPAQGVDEVLSALCLAAPRAHQILTLGDDDFGGRAVRLGSKSEDARLIELVRAASRMAPDHLVCRPLAGATLVATLDAVREGMTGVMLVNAAATARAAVDRLATDLATTRSVDVATARELVANTFDLVLEVGRLRDGRVRVVRVAELREGAPRDVFTFVFRRTAAGGAIEGTFSASGIVPRLVEDLAARGMPLDTAIFRRHSIG
jgi:pilus assembly protein CpaF